MFFRLSFVHKYLTKWDFTFLCISAYKEVLVFTLVKDREGQTSCAKLPQQLLLRRKLELSSKGYDAGLNLTSLERFKYKTIDTSSFRQVKISAA